jgi:hypothetical protein
MSNPSIKSLLESGLTLVAINKGMKSPLLKNWNERINVITSVNQSEFLYDKNIGLAHAYCKPTPTVAIDIDHYHHARIWFSTHSVELELLIKAKDAVVIWSGKALSLKLIYRLPHGRVPLESKKILGPDGNSAVEFRCATKDRKTVQDILPPSIHPDGHQYNWLGDGNPLNIPEINPELLSIWHLLITKGSKVADRKKISSSFLNNRPETPWQIAIIKSALECIDADCDYETWRNIVWAILSTGWSCAEDISYEWSKSAPDRFEEDAFWLVANSYTPDHSSQITVGSIYHYARLGGWNG